MAGSGSQQPWWPGKEKAHKHKLRAEKEEHQCSGTGSHTGHRYVNMLTPPSFLQHRESTGVFQGDRKPGDFSVMSKSRGRWMVADRNSRGDRAKKKPSCAERRRALRSQVALCSFSTCPKHETTQTGCQQAHHRPLTWLWNGSITTTAISATTITASQCTYTEGTG